MRIQYILFIVLMQVWPATIILAQRPVYKITADLDTASHTLTGNIDISYTNLSQDILDSIGIHLWPDAYKERNTALVHQKLNMGDLSLYRAKEQDLGGLYDLAFSSWQQKIQFNHSKDHIDIGWIHLSDPLEPGQTIHISSPYTLKIPKSFSRIGQTGEAYQLTQWYPHIAVYDEQGWHTMPYLDIGEFFNDFADYEVIIRTPVRYRVAATGLIVSEETEGNIIERTFSAKNVIDFAWFTSPSFRHEKKEINVGGDEDVTLHIFVDSALNNHWDAAMLYAERALKFYSNWLGPYPYPQMTVVHTPYSAAGFMEYPMVAQISYTSDTALLDRVIAHEIGHTWLYGILANNERDHAWLDEGFNTFIEAHYMNEYYQDPREFAFPLIVHSRQSMDQYEALQHVVRSQGNILPPQSSPIAMRDNQYTVSAYQLPAQGLRLMEEKFGKDTMILMFRQYFQDHQFTHVSPRDAQASFEKICKCNLAWYFDAWIRKSHKIDYRITEFNHSQNYVVIENRSSESLPLSLTEFSNDDIIRKHWLSGFSGKLKIDIQSNTNEIRLYDKVMAPNKQWFRNVKPRNFLPVVSLFPKIGNYERPSLAITPVLGYNLADGAMPGVFITSTLLPQPKFKFLLAPFYGGESRKFRFLGEGRYINDVSFASFDKILFAFTASQFGSNLDPLHAFRDQFTKWSPTIGLRFQAASAFSHVTKWLKYRYVDIHLAYGRSIDTIAGAFVNEELDYGIHELTFQIRSDTVLMPYNAKAFIQAGKGFVRVNADYRQHFRGRNQLKGIWVHAFAGWLPFLEDPDANVLLTFNGFATSSPASLDYMYDEWLMGRKATEGNLTRQIFIKDAGLKTLSKIGFSDDWMIGGGASIALPLSVFHLYMDGAIYPSPLTNRVILNYSGGLSVILMKDVFEIYLPLLDSRDIRESLIEDGKEKWFQRISFQANFKLSNPISLIDYFQFGIE